MVVKVTLPPNRIRNLPVKDSLAFAMNSAALTRVPSTCVFCAFLVSAEGDHRYKKSCVSFGIMFLYETGLKIVGQGLQHKVLNGSAAGVKAL